MFQYRLKNIDSITIRQPEIDKVHLTELGNAEIFVRLFGTKVCYVADKRKWYIWDGIVWAEDSHDTVRQMAATIPQVLREVANGNPQVIKWAAASES
ncbi:MAG: hypothetical protein ACKO96_02740, partial [Flammeovirgaceae bacterium]